MRLKGGHQNTPLALHYELFVSQTLQTSKSFNKADFMLHISTLSRKIWN